MADDQNIGLLLFYPYRALEDRVQTRLNELGYEVTPAQARVFQRIGPDGTRLTDLAEQARVTKPTANFLVDQLERSGLVERVPDPIDKRARLVTITAKGREMVPLGAEVIAEIEAEWSDHLGARRMTELRRTLTRLREITDPYI